MHTHVMLLALAFGGGFLMLLSTVYAQQPSTGSGANIPCPVPMQISLTAPPPVAATVNLADFPSFPPSAIFEPNFNGGARNRHFRHTFSWKPETDCCQYIRGSLTLAYKALSSGQSANSSDAGNDTWVIFKGSNALARGKIYTSFPFASGVTGTMTIPLTPDMLAGDQLSFLVQDDTSITSAKLEVVACCLKR